MDFILRHSQFRRDGSWIVYIRQDENRKFQIYKTSVITAVADKEPTPQCPILVQSYPNPFNSQTTLYYQLSVPSHVNIIVYNLLGKEVYRLVDKKLAAGEYPVRWDGRNQMGETGYTFI